VPRMPYNPYLRSAVRFVEETTDPYLNLFRRFIPPIGGRLDISPIIAILVLWVVAGLVSDAIRG
jgi:YggT family protein